MPFPRPRTWISVALAGGLLLGSQARGGADTPRPATTVRGPEALTMPPGRPTPVARASDPPVVTAQVSDAYVGGPVPSGFVGTSIEYPALHIYTGRDPRRVDPVLITLLRELAPGQAPVLRIGGDSTDNSWVPQRGTVLPGGVTYAITPNWISTVRALADRMNGRLILGVNLAGDRPAIAGAEGRALLQGIGRRRIDALEIGNEPDLYAGFAWYRNSAHQFVYARQANYGLSQYEADFARWRAVLPSVPLTGPAIARTTWLSGVRDFTAAEPGLRMLTIHRYPLRGCGTPPSSPSYASIPNLLADSSSAGLAQGFASSVAQTHAAGIAFRVAEMNSVACRGRWGVSNTFASALWALDTLYQFALAGVDGVNLHMLPSAAYELFSPSQRRGVWRAYVRPEYYGLLMFARAVPSGSHLLQTTVPDGPVKVYATRGADGHVRVMLINKDPSSTVTVATGIQYATGTATLQRLRAPSVQAIRGVTLAGQSFGAQTTTGRPAGTYRQELVTPDALGHYTVSLPAGSAAMLTR